jgi:hypothetical protein
MIRPAHKEDHHMHIASIGIDLGKNTFRLVALGDSGNVVVRTKFSRKQLLCCTAKSTDTKAFQSAQ